jgi:hypothetical protein
MRTYKCWYVYCRFDGKVKSEDAVKEGTKYYHKECHRNFKNLKRIRELCLELDGTVVFARLNQVLLELITVRKIEIDYILFVLETLLEDNVEIHLPYGLSYKLNDFKMKKAYTQSFTKKQLVIHSS